MTAPNMALARNRNNPYTEARAQYLMRAWQTDTPAAEVLAVFNDLPGPTVTKKQMVNFARRLGVYRPTGAKRNSYYASVGFDGVPDNDVMTDMEILAMDGEFKRATRKASDRMQGIRFDDLPGLELREPPEPPVAKVYIDAIRAAHEARMMALRVPVRGAYERMDRRYE